MSTKLSETTSSPAGRANRRRGDTHGTHEVENAERWLLTYSDMITLLLVLFIVLYAISELNHAKFEEFKQSVTHTKLFNVPHGTTAAKTTVSTKVMTQAQLRNIERALSGALRSKGLLGDVVFSLSSSGLTEGLIADSTFFKTNSAQLSPVGVQIVDISAGVLRQYRNNIQVAGYTDNEPIKGGPYANNWALSAARAATVVVRMTVTDGVQPTRLILLGYGQYHPSASNATPTGRAENRRVNIVISSSLASK